MRTCCCKPAPAPSTAPSGPCSSDGTQGWPTTTQPGTVRPRRREHPTLPHGPPLRPCRARGPGPPSPVHLQTWPSGLADSIQVHKPCLEPHVGPWAPELRPCRLSTGRAGINASTSLIPAARSQGKRAAVGVEREMGSLFVRGSKAVKGLAPGRPNRCRKLGLP